MYFSFAFLILGHCSLSPYAIMNIKLEAFLGDLLFLHRKIHRPLEKYDYDRGANFLYIAFHHTLYQNDGNYVRQRNILIGKDSLAMMS